MCGNARGVQAVEEAGEQGGGGARGGVAVSVLLAGRKTTGRLVVGWAAGGPAQELGWDR